MYLADENAANMYVHHQLGTRKILYTSINESEKIDKSIVEHVIEIRYVHIRRLFVYNKQTRY